jgi:hypothetical protein
MCPSKLSVPANPFKIWYLCQNSIVDFKFVALFLPLVSMASCNVAPDIINTLYFAPFIRR